MNTGSSIIRLNVSTTPTDAITTSDPPVSTTRMVKTIIFSIQLVDTLIIVGWHGGVQIVSSQEEIIATNT